MNKEKMVNQPILTGDLKDKRPFLYENPQITSIPISDAVLEKIKPIFEKIKEELEQCETK